MRVDAARNHNVILEVAGDLFCRQGPTVSMDAIASAACVGKGTLFRRFGDRDGLIQAVVRERTEAWWRDAQARATDESVPARERALRLVDEMFELIVLRLRPLMATMEKSACVGPPPWLDQLAALIAEVRPDVDADFLAKVIIGSMRSEMVQPGAEDTLRVNVAALTSSVLGD
ncbi:TetR/AcrR family transcriptional regulator [Kutzneria sp. NPDC052558]|uniref:TetR/AcrR family transcriptional regulator n=1 Tax=Kutzneria sp. NPDC052558 TaxID=3364121 RepID=UPI0037C92A94